MNQLVRTGSAPINRRSVLGALSAIVMSPHLMAAPGFPSKPLKTVLMFPPGGGADGMARLVANKLQQSLGQPVIIENRPGASGVLAANFVKALPPDGYTLLHAGIALLTLTPNLNAAARYSDADFVPVAGLSTSPPVLVARADFPAKNLKELVALAKARPGAISYGTWGPGSIPHLAGEWMSRELGVSLTPVPYKGEIPVVQDLQGDQLELGWVSLPAVINQLKSAKIKLIGIAAAKRSPLLPDVPTFVELGLKDFVLSGYTGYFVLKGTPAEVVSALNEKINAVLQQADVRAAMLAQAQEPLVLSPTELGALVASEARRLQPVIEALKPSLR